MQDTFVEKVSALNQTALKSISLNSERAIIKNFIDSGVANLGCDFGFSFVKNKPRTNFHLLYKDKNTPYTPAQPRNEGITALAFKSRRPQFVENVSEAQIIRSDARRAMKAVAVVPMTYRRANYGTLDFCYFGTHKFTREEKSLCEYIGNAAANIITIYRLLNEQKAALSAREQFLAIVSHEVKTPITSLSMYAQHLLGSAKKEAWDQKKIDGLESMNRQVVRLTKLVNDILVFTKYNVGKLEIHLDLADLVDLINLAIKQMKLTAGAREISFTHDSDLVVEGDRDRLEQVVINLLSNAIKFSPPTSKIFVTAKKTNKEIIVSVSDQGMGIPKDKQANVFDRFFQGHNSNVSGFGLGLYISKEIIEKHRGKIWVESQLGKGSTFYFSLASANGN